MNPIQNRKNTNIFGTRWLAHDDKEACAVTSWMTSKFCFGHIVIQFTCPDRQIEI